MTSQREENHQSLPSWIGSWIQQNAKWVQAIPALYPLARIARRLMLGPLPSVQGIEGELDSASSPNFRLLIVSPPTWHSDLKPFEPATGHFYYDLWQSAREFFNSDEIHWTEVREGNSAWIENLVDEIQKISPTHILIHAEENPSGNPRDLANLALELGKKFSGWVTLLMYDSIFWNHLLVAEEFATIYPRTRVIATDTDLSLLSVSHKAGPALLPTSLKSLEILQKRYAEDRRLQPEYDLTHIGTLYGYRSRKVEKLRRMGLDVVVNPHRVDVSGLPEYYEFYRAFRNSKLTLNFSRANGARLPHAKTRILEASLFGSLLVTDNKRMTMKILPEEAFIYFKTLGELAKESVRLSREPTLLEKRKIVSERASIEVMHLFWRRFQELNGLK